MLCYTSNLEIFACGVIFAASMTVTIVKNPAYYFLYNVLFTVFNNRLYNYSLTKKTMVLEGE